MNVRPTHELAHLISDDQHDQDLDGAGQYGEGADAAQPLEVELQADGEHQEDDPQVGQEVDLLDVIGDGVYAQDIRPEQHAHQEVTYHQGHAQLGEHDRHYRRAHKDEGDIEQ